MILLCLYLHLLLNQLYFFAEILPWNLYSFLIWLFFPLVFLFPFLFISLWFLLLLFLFIIFPLLNSLVDASDFVHESLISDMCYTSNFITSQSLTSLQKVVIWVFWHHIIVPCFEANNNKIHSSFKRHRISPLDLIGQFIEMFESILVLEMLRF